MRRASVSVIAALALLVAAIAIGESAGGATTPPPIKRVSITGTACANGFFCYKPMAITINRGTKIVWTNTTGTIHTVTRCSKAACMGVSGGTGKQTGLSSPTIQPRRTYAFLFKLPGTYRYFCKIHGYSIMHGIVTVK